jgi:hypothetical protein
MAGTKAWKVDIFIGEHEQRTQAEARLVVDDRVTVSGRGTARLNPADRDVPEIGDELAAARALSDLAHRLLDLAAEDIDDATHAPGLLPR